jgi:hypothetical protein
LIYILTNPQMEKQYWEEKSSSQTPHSCSHCNRILATTSNSARSMTRLKFSQEVPEARYAATLGCPVFRDFVDLFNRQSRSSLIKAHLLPTCSCCETWHQRLTHVMTSLGSQPFQLTLQAIPVGPKKNNTVHSSAYLDCGGGRLGPRLNAYTYKGKIEWLYGSISKANHG